MLLRDHRVWLLAREIYFSVGVNMENGVWQCFHAPVE